MSNLFRALQRGAIDANLGKNSFKLFSALLEQTLGNGKAIDNFTNKELAALGGLRLDRFHLALNSILESGLFNRKSTHNHTFEYRIGDDFLANYHGEFDTPTLAKKQAKLPAKKSQKNAEQCSQTQKKAKNSANNAHQYISKTEQAVRKAESTFQKTESNHLNSDKNLRKTESDFQKTELNPLNSEEFSEKQSGSNALDLYSLLSNLIKQLQLVLPFGQNTLLHAIGESLSQTINFILQATRPTQSQLSENTPSALNSSTLINTTTTAGNKTKINQHKQQANRENQAQKNTENSSVNSAVNQTNQADKQVNNSEKPYKRSSKYNKSGYSKRNGVSGGGFLNKETKSAASPDMHKKLPLPNIISSNNHASCYYHLNKLKPQQQKDVLAVFNDMAKRGKIRSSPAGLLVKLAQLAEKDQFTALEATHKPIAGRNLSSQEQTQRLEQEKARKQRMDEWGEVLSLLRFEEFTSQSLAEIAKTHKAEHLLIKYEKEIAQHKKK